MRHETRIAKAVQCGRIFCGTTLGMVGIAALLMGTASAAWAQSATTTTLTASATKVAMNGSATLTATVKRTGGGGTPTGTVTFAYDTDVLGTASLNGSGVATLTASASGVPVGTFGITAMYNGDGSDSGSVSPALNVSVADNTATTLIAGPTGVQQGQPVNLRATVARTGGATGNPGGTVTFFYGKIALGSAYVGKGLAVLTESTAGQALGNYGITATYNGDSTDFGSESSGVTVSVTPAVDVLTHRNNVARTGLQPAETILNTSNVNTSQFGKLFTFSVDGYLYAQPLYVSAYTMNDSKSHNVLYGATSNATVYAFDADGNNPTAGYLWSRSLIPSGEQVVTTSDYSCSNPAPATGIIGTPVIDRVRGVMYVVAKTKLVNGNSTTYYHRIHALSLKDGSDQLNGPTVITATVPGTGDGSSGGNVTFNSLRQNERAALAEAEGTVWITYASHCDIGPYHGWTLGYNASDVSQQTAVYNNTPNGGDGGIWMVAGAPSADNLGHLYTVAGNGTFDANESGLDYSDSVQRFNVTAGSLTAVDYFTPSNQNYLSGHDLDLGTGDGMLFDDPASGVAPHLLATPDKTGQIYLLNRDYLGGYDTGTHGPDSLNGDLEDFTAPNSIFTNFGYFNSRVYTGVDGQPLAAYEFTPGTATTAGTLATSPTMQTGVTFSGGSESGAQLVISANGTQDAIVWAAYLSGSNEVLYAFDANNLGTELYASTQNSGRDAGPAPVKFTAPVVANGKVYVGGQGQVAVYGLLSDGMKKPVQGK
jgi:hypothetical protein